MFFVYILQSKSNGSYYIGSCENLDIRLKQHNNGLTKSTKRYAPWQIIYTEKYPNLSQAIIRERQIKSWKKRSAIEKVIEHSNFNKS